MEDRAWQDMARAALPGLYKLAWGMLRQEADAQDAVQSALMNAWQHREGVQPQAAKAYLARAVINQSRDLLRRRKRVTPVAEFPETEALPAGDTLRAVEQAVAALPEKLRLVVYLRYLQDFSEQETAQALGLPVTTVRSRLHRARLQLRTLLEQEVELP